jgi:proliferating cell nuclear antigen
MFKAKIKDSKVVRGIFEAVSSIISEVLLKVDKDGISMTAMDLSHICLVSLKLKKEDLDEFEVKEPLQLGINLEDLVKIIKRSSGNDEITFSHDPKEKKLIIEMKPPEAKKARKFTIALIDIEGEEINLESLESMEFDNKCSFNLKYLDEAIKDAEIFAEVLQIKVDKNLIFSTTGNIGDMEYVLEGDELISKELNAESSGIFAISFLKNILKIGSIADSIDVSLKSEAPLKIIASILNSSRVLYFLAPRVEEEDDSMYED